MPKKKNTKKPRTLMQQVKDLRSELLDGFHDALDKIFDERPDPPLVGGEEWLEELAEDLREICDDFEERAQDDVRDAVQKLAAKTKKTTKKPQRASHARSKAQRSTR